MKTILIILGALVALMIGGCVSLIGWGIWETSRMPDYINKESISQMYGDDIEKIHHALKSNISLKKEDGKVELSEAILGIFTEINSRETDLYKRYDADVGGKFMNSGAGVAKITLNGKVEKCMIYKMEVDNLEYLICIRDPKRDLSANQAEVATP